MNCQLPATGGDSLGIVVIGLLLVVSGVGILLAVRHRGARAVLPVLVLLAAAIGGAAARPAAAATDCPTSTVLAPAAPTTQLAPPSSGPSTTVAPTSTTIAPTMTSTLPTTTSPSAPPTTIGAVTFCSALLPNDSGGFMVDVLIMLSGGTGTFSARAPSTGACDGEVVNSGLVVDSTLFDPADYCAANLPGSQLLQAASAGVWDSTPPASWYACNPSPPPDTTTPPTTTTEPPTTTSSTTTTSTTTTSTTTTSTTTTTAA